MKKIIQLAAVTGLLVAAITPAHAFWGGGNNWSPWGGGNNWSPWGNNRNYGSNYGPRNYGSNYGPRNYGYNYGPNYGPRNYGPNYGPRNYGPNYAPRSNVPGKTAPRRSADNNSVNETDEKRSIWSGNNPWKSWRAPWSNDDSRWGSGPWDSFGDSMTGFISEMEGDVDMKMKIRGEGAGKNQTTGRYRGRGYGNSDNFSYGYNRNPSSYYGRPVPQQNMPSTQAPVAPQSK